MKASSCFLFIQNNLCLKQHVSGIQPFVHLHGGNAGNLLSINHRPLNRRGSPILRKQRRMDIHAAIRRHLKDFRRQDLSESDNHHNICLIFPQFFDTVRIPNLLWLKHRNLIFQGSFLHRWKLHLPTPPFWLVRLRHCKYDLMSCLNQSLKSSY